MTNCSARSSMTTSRPGRLPPMEPAYTRACCRVCRSRMIRPVGSPAVTAVLLDARMVRQPSDSPLLARHSFVGSNRHADGFTCQRHDVSVAARRCRYSRCDRGRLRCLRYRCLSCTGERGRMYRTGDTLRVTVSAISSLSSTTGASVAVTAVCNCRLCPPARSNGTMPPAAGPWWERARALPHRYFRQRRPTMRAAGNCPGPLEAVTAVVNAVTADPVTQDGSRCGDGSLTLTATDTAAVRWYATASGGSVLASGYTFVTPA